jgi:hypothetical protein
MLMDDEPLITPVLQTADVRVIEVELLQGPAAFDLPGGERVTTAEATEHEISNSRAHPARIQVVQGIGDFDFLPSK